jgi:hypothetical protein
VAQAARIVAMFLRTTKSACTSGKSARNTVMYTFYLAGTLVEELNYAI